MNAQMQQGMFTHGKCTKCGYLALLDKFEQKRINEVKSKSDDSENAMTMEMYQLIIKCPLCGDEFCEALFANEVN